MKNSILILLCTFILTSCKKEDSTVTPPITSKAVKFTLKVLNVEDGKPLKGAKVTVQNNNSESVISGYSDENGIASLECTFLGYVNVYVSKDNYNDNWFMLFFNKYTSIDTNINISSLTSKFQPPNKPVILSPDSGATFISSLFKWTCTHPNNDSMTYELLINTKPSLNVNPRVSGIKTNQVDYVNVKSNSKVYTAIVAIDKKGLRSISKFVEFTPYYVLNEFERKDLVLFLPFTGGLDYYSPYNLKIINHNVNFAPGPENKNIPYFNGYNYLEIVDDGKLNLDGNFKIKVSFSPKINSNIPKSDFSHILGKWSDDKSNNSYSFQLSNNYFPGFIVNNSVINDSLFYNLYFDNNAWYELTIEKTDISTSMYLGSQLLKANQMRKMQQGNLNLCIGASLGGLHGFNGYINYIYIYKN